MSYGIMGATRHSHMLTYQTTHPVRVIYFDGESATLAGTGQMDTQMLHIYSNVSGRPDDGGDGGRRGGLYEEYDRATGLCDWLSAKGLRGKGWGYEGVVRMNAGFEVIWCDFESRSLRLISHLNVTAPLLPSVAPPAPPPYDLIEDHVEANAEAEIDAPVDASSSYLPLPTPPHNPSHSSPPSSPASPPNWRNEDREPFMRSQGWQWFVSATTHYGSSGMGPGLGEQRVRVQMCGMLSYYNSRSSSQALARAEIEQKALNLTREGWWKGGYGNETTRQAGLTALMRRRRSHRLNRVTVVEAVAMRNRSEEVLGEILAGNLQCSGIDWMAVTREIVQRNSVFLAELQTLTSMPLPARMNQTEVDQWLAEMRSQIHAFWVGFLEYPDVGGAGVIIGDGQGQEWQIGSRLYNQTYSRCRYHYTRLLVEEEGIMVGHEESELKAAVEETVGTICAVVIEIGFSVEKLWMARVEERETGSTGGRSMGGGRAQTREKGERRGWIDAHLRAETRRWKTGLEELMSWLGWAGEWTRCEERCAWDVSCFLFLRILMEYMGFTDWSQEICMHSPFSTIDCYAKAHWY